MSRTTANLSVRAGDPIPSIGLRATDGYLLNLRSWVGKSPVAHVFFAGPTLSGAPRAEADVLVRELAAAVQRLDAAGIGVTGITTDNERQQKDYARQLNLPFLLLSDERQIASQALGVPLTEKRGNTNVGQPVLISVDETGIVRGIYHQPDPRLVAAIILETFRELLPA
ncbi:MAG: redoxin family protein [Candidatus Limnocylindria bacterium]